jgi:hypothetical protein
MIENVSSKIKIQKLYTKGLKEIYFYLEYDPLYIAHNISATIENDNYYTLRFSFRGEDYYIETCNRKFWNDEDILIEYISNCIIDSENERVGNLR